MKNSNRNDRQPETGGFRLSVIHHFSYFFILTSSFLLFLISLQFFSRLSHLRASQVPKDWISWVIRTRTMTAR